MSKYLLLEINVTKSFLFRMKYVIDGGCLFDYGHIIIILSFQYMNELIHLLIT